ncbi:beta-N-acetylhexosaminidase [Propioniciclava soli]|uniref:beta-N-acetylhexosaminidase n=1 Tax=Propioniciclava soli TaxID=2775081 RepID=UPI001E51EF25|nr:beta-N-acetylhexosaminidase [Propioniciclava soli]
MSLLAEPAARFAALVPTPVSATLTEGVWELPEHPGVTGPAAWARTACRMLASCGAERTTDATEAAGGALTLTRVDELTDGAYRLEVTAGGVTLAAGEEAGLVHGLRTFLQLLDPGFGLPTARPGLPRTVACCRIEDAPRHAWRGAHIDVARHFHPLPWLFAFVDTLAAHKFNVLHLHLTDDQGWRFEVPKHPRLTEVGAHRPGTIYPGMTEHDGIPRGGFYTQDQLRALVAHAAERGITIVPEVDVPGHVRALLAAYPEYGWGEGLPIATHFDVLDEVLWLDDRALALVEDIYTDLLAVFPSEIIHIGGDECPTTQWRDNPEADALAASRGLGGVEELQAWFTRHLRDWLAARGRRTLGWDEIVEGDDIEDVVVMSWRGVEPGRAALARGHEVVMAPCPLLYFDYHQSDGEDEPLARNPARRWEDVVAFDPAEGVAEADRPRLLGVQGQAWSEFFTTVEHVEYMVWPRLCALAEVAWSGPADPAAFEPRLRAHVERLAAKAVNHRPLDGPHPWQAGGTGPWRRRPPR